MWVLCVYSMYLICVLYVGTICTLCVVCVYIHKMRVYRSIQIYYEYMWTAIIHVCTFTRCICIEREREREREMGWRHAHKWTLQYSKTLCNTLHHTATLGGRAKRKSLPRSHPLTECVQHIAACCSVLQRVAMCCNVLYSYAKKK